MMLSRTSDGYGAGLGAAHPRRFSFSGTRSFDQSNRGQGRTMQQLFSTRNYSVRDFEEWDERKELVLAPKFQRRDVWNPKAKAYLIDTIIRGKPIPKLYMRQTVVPAGRLTTR